MLKTIIEILLKTIGFVAVAFCMGVVAFAINRHNYAVNKLNELAKQHKAPDSALTAILVADSLYMYSNHR